MNLRDLADAASQLAAQAFDNQTTLRFHPADNTELMNTSRYVTLLWQRAGRSLLSVSPPNLRDLVCLGEEMLATHMLTRVALAVRCNHPEFKTAQPSQDPRALMAEQSQILRQWGDTLRADESLLPALLSWERLQRRLQHWTDMLLSAGLEEGNVQDFLYDSSRARAFTKEEAPEPASLQLQSLGLRQALPHRKLSDPLRTAVLRSLVELAWRGVEIPSLTEPACDLPSQSSRIELAGWLLKLPESPN